MLFTGFYYFITIYGSRINKRGKIAKKSLNYYTHIILLNRLSEEDKILLSFHPPHILTSSFSLASIKLESKFIISLIKFNFKPNIGQLQY